MARLSPLRFGKENIPCSHTSNSLTHHTTLCLVVVFNLGEQYDNMVQNTSNILWPYNNGYHLYANWEQVYSNSKQKSIKGRLALQKVLRWVFVDGLVGANALLNTQCLGPRYWPVTYFTSYHFRRQLIPVIRGVWNAHTIHGIGIRNGLVSKLKMQCTIFVYYTRCTASTVSLTMVFFEWRSTAVTLFILLIIQDSNLF